MSGIADFFKKNAAGFGGVLGSAVSGVFNLLSQKQAAKYNEELAAKQNSWNIAQWERTNAYNSPAAQKARLEQAGLNADMMYGNGALQNVATSSPQMTAGSPMSPLDWTSLNPASSFLDNQLKQAQIDNINADTEKKGAETSILASDKAFRDAYNQGVLNTMNSKIYVDLKNAELTDQQIKESQARIAEINKNVEQIGANIDSLRNAITNDNKRVEIEKALSDANIKALAAKCSLDYAQAKSISDQLDNILRRQDDEHAIMEEQKINLGHEGDILLYHKEGAKFEAKIKTMSGPDSDLSVYQNIMMFLSQLTFTVGNVLHR